MFCPSLTHPFLTSSIVHEPFGPIVLTLVKMGEGEEPQLLLKSQKSER